MADVDDPPAPRGEGAGRGGVPPSGVPPWLLGQRVTVPDRPAGFYARPALSARCRPAERRATLLVAPAGFGKTTLLAACCRDARDRGVPVAWLVLDGRDSPDLLDAYVAYAFQAAGLEVFGTGAGSGGAPYPGAGSGGTPYPGAGSGGAPYPGAGSGGAPYPGAGSGGTPYPGAGSGGAPYPSAGSGGTPYPSAGSGGTPYPSAGTGGTPYPSAGTGGAPYPSAGTGGAPYPGAGSGGAPYPGAGSGGAPYPGAGSGGAPYPSAGPGGAPYPGAGSGDAPYPSAAGALDAVALRSGPVILALDEAEQLADAALGAVIDFVLQSAPVNLHLAIACRELPGGIDVASAVLAHETEILTAEDLRFTRDEIAGFFGHALSRRDLARVAAASEGWPIALRVRRNESRLEHDGGFRVMRDLMGNWMDSRLWGGLDDADGEFLHDLGLLEWIEAELLDEVVGEAGAMGRLRGLRALDGLLEPIRSDGAEVWRLHPLVREHCARRRLRGDPARYRAVHRRAAAALARRGRIVAALRHAREAGDAAVAATILLRTGGVRFGLREGTERLVAANDLLPEEAVAGNPRLAMVRCAALAASGRLAEARRLYATVPADASDVELSADRCFARAMIADHGCETSMTAEMEEAFGELPRLAGAPELDPVTHAASEYLLGLMHNIAGRPRDAMRRLERARDRLAGLFPMSTPAVALQAGLAAMVLGRAGEARRWYAKSLELAMSSFVARPALVRGINALIHELELERDRVDAAAAPPPRPGDVGDGVQWHVSLASADLAVEHARAVDGTGAALAVVDALSADAQRTPRPVVVRHLAAQRVSLLADAGSVGAAQAAWTEAALPVADGDCIDLDRQGWREAESVACARLRLLAAQREFEAARRFGASVLAMAAERGLARTAMRVRALCLRVEHLAGEEERASAQLGAYLAALGDADYPRPLVRESAAADLLGRFVGTCSDAARRRMAQGLLARVGEGVVPSLSVRELDVLRRLETDRDDDIAAALRLSRHGVRYHVGNILGKLGVRGRRDAVRRARELGILPRLLGQ